MKSLIHADIFFFITSIAVIALTAILVVVLVYLIQILRDVKDVSRVVKKETRDLAGDISDLRFKAKREGLKLKHFADFFSKIFRRNKGRSAKKKT